MMDSDDERERKEEEMKENPDEFEGNSSSEETEEEQTHDPSISMFERKSMTLSRAQMQDKKEQELLDDMDDETRELNDLFKERRFIIKQRSAFKLYWNYIIILSATYNSFQTPLIIGFP